MAEWCDAVDSSSSLFEDVGSNPKFTTISAKSAEKSGSHFGNVVFTSEGEFMGRSVAEHEILEGKPLALSDGKPVISLIKKGKGKIIVCACNDLFSDASLGKNTDVPNKRQRQLLKILFDWFGNQDLFDPTQKSGAS